MSKNQFQSNLLDFEQIKAKLKKKYEDSGEFDDFDFSGSGVNALLNVLAENTHIGAMADNFATNEAFLDTAQLRGSVVSHAKAHNYLPRSVLSSRAKVTVTLSGVDESIGREERR